MELKAIQYGFTPRQVDANPDRGSVAHLSFEDYIRSFPSTQKPPPRPQPTAMAPPVLQMSATTPLESVQTKVAAATAAYTRMSAPPATAAQSDWEKYRDDQLLSNPGGDDYYRAPPKATDEEDGFFERVGKDIGDAVENVGNFFGHLFFGAKTQYRDDQGEVKETRDRGLLGAIGDFVKDIGSALTLGAWRPDGEKAPETFGERAEFVFGKLKEALIGDVIGGVGGSLNHMAEDLVLAGWNLVEVIPDATIGNFEVGEKLVSNIFDNGQVAIDYLTDVLPAGEAWLRVHSADLSDGQFPVTFNLEMPERHQGDTRWQYVRNTPLRKTIETIGSLLADVAALSFTDQISFSSEKTRR